MDPIDHQIDELESGYLSQLRHERREARIHLILGIIVGTPFGILLMLILNAIAR